MKRLLTAALALSLLGGSIVSAQPYGGHPDDHRGDNRGDRHDQQGPHQWARGQRLPARAAWPGVAERRGRVPVSRRAP